MTARSGGRDQGLDSDLVTEALESTNTTADGARGLASVEVSRTELLVGSGSSNEGVRDDQDFMSDGHHRPLVATVAHDAAVARAERGIDSASGGLARLDQRHP